MGTTPLAPDSADARRRVWPGPAFRLTADQAVIAGVALIAWALAWLSTVAGRPELLAHDTLLTRSGLPLPLALVAFLAAWQVMTAAMMLPTSLPMFHLFARVSSGQDRPRLVLAVFLTAYAAVWTAFAVGALAGDAVLHWLADQWPALGSRPWVISGLALLLAGAFQFSPLKEQCLRECRHPSGLLLRHYGRGVRRAWSLGLRHGLFCLGCCWALMLVMFAVGVGNLAFMGVLTGVMVVEKTMPWGRRLVPFVGVTLVLWGLLVLLQPPWLPAPLRGL